MVSSILETDKALARSLERTHQETVYWKNHSSCMCFQILGKNLTIHLNYSVMLINLDKLDSYKRELTW